MIIKHIYILYNAVPSGKTTTRKKRMMIKKYQPGQQTCCQTLSNLIKNKY